MSQPMELIKSEVFALRPVLKEIAEEHGVLILQDYIRGWKIPKAEPDPVFLECFFSVVNRIFGKEIASQARNQLAQKPLVSTIDHHGIWNHPIFVNSALIYSLFFNDNELVITLPTESVSLNNTSSWSGCLLMSQSDGNLKRFSFFPDRLKTLPVFAVPPITSGWVEKLSEQVPTELRGLLEALDIKNILGMKDFSTQASLLSFNFWKKIFPSAPRLIYCPLETLVSEYLLKIFEDPNHALTRLVTTAQGRELWREHFENEHTFMFWRLDAKGRRQSLSDLEENLDRLKESIKNKQIYPSSPLCFAVLLYAGVAAVGGFTQTTWLTGVKQELMEILKKLDPKKAIKHIFTKNFAESALATLPANGKQFASAVDLWLKGKDKYAVYKAQATKMTLGQSLDLAMPIIHRVVVGSKLNVRKNES